MLDLVPWPIRHPTIVLFVLLTALVVVFSFVWAAYLRHRLKRRAAAELRFLDEPSLHDAKAKDETLAVVRGRIVGVRNGKPVPVGTVLLDAVGMKAVSSDCALSLERPQGRIMLLGPFSVLVGSHEGFPVGLGRRVLHAGDEVVVGGRWVVEQAGTTNYRDVATFESIMPSLDNLELAYAGPPKSLGLAEWAFARGLAWGAFFWAAAMTGGAYAALEGARSAALEGDKIGLASFAYVSPFLKSNVRSFLLGQTSHEVDGTFKIAEEWAAIEYYFDDSQECLRGLDSLRRSGRLEDEVRIGLACGGVGSKRRAAEALVHLGEFARAAEVLRDAPPLKEGVPLVPDPRLDMRVALVMGDFMGAAKLLRTYGHPAFSPMIQSCVVMGLEARGGSFLAREQLASKAQAHWSCALLQADMLDGDKRITFLRNLPKELRPERAKDFFLPLQMEVEPGGFHDLPEEDKVEEAKGLRAAFQFERAGAEQPIPAYEERPLLDAPMYTRGSGSLRAIEMSALERIEKREDRQALWLKQAMLEAQLGVFSALVGEEAKSLALLNQAVERIPSEATNRSYVQRLRAALALRFGDPKAIHFVEVFEGRHLAAPWMFLRAAVAVRAGEGGAEPYYADYVGSQLVMDATVRGDGFTILAGTVPHRLMRHLLVAGPRILIGREPLIDKMRLYDPECTEVPCPLEYLASQAATRALVLQHLGAREIRRGEEQKALEERARKLREPLYRRDIAMIMVLLDHPYKMAWGKTGGAFDE